MTTTLQHLGRGPSFPMRPDPGLSYADGTEKVDQAIRLILDTEPGERAMRPGFGCGLRRYLMEPNSPGTRGLIKRDVTRALARWEPRIKLESVEVIPHPTEPSRVDIGIAFVLLRHGLPSNLVYPFYLE